MEVDFTFLFCRVIAQYGIDPMRCLSLPVRIFWVLAGNVDRLRAQDQIELLDVSSMAQAMGSAEAQKEFRAHLVERLGTISRAEAPRTPREGILALMQEVGTD